MPNKFEILHNHNKDCANAENPNWQALYLIESNLNTELLRKISYLEGTIERIWAGKITLTDKTGKQWKAQEYVE